MSNPTDSQVDSFTPQDTQGAKADQREELSNEELMKASGEELPDREQMSLVNANLAAPVNVAAALNVLSDDSIAVANAEQTGTISQTN